MARFLPPYPLRDFSGGLNNKDEPYLIPDNMLADVQNAIIGRGIISKRHGFVKYTPVALANPITTLYDFFRNNGTKEFLATSGTSLYKDSAGTLNPIAAYKYVTLEDCEDPWNEITNANVTVAVDATDKKYGTNSVKLTVVAASVANELLAAEAIPSTDISSGSTIRFWVKCSVATAAGDLQLLLDDTAQCASPVHTLNIPVLVANVWAQVELAYNGAVTGSNAIISIGLKQVTDLGACTIWIDDVEYKTTTTIGDPRMMTYKDRSINDVVLIADQGKLKAYNGTDVQEIKPYYPTTEEQTNPGLNDLSNLTNFRALAIKKDRIFAAAHPTVKNRVSFCYREPSIGYAVYDYFPAPFFIDVAAEENDEIVELKVFRDALVIFCKRTSPWVIYGDGMTQADYQLHKINTPSGCVSAKSVQFVGNNIFYLSDDHVYALFSTDQNYVSAEIVSYNVEKTLESISLADKEKAVGTFFDNKYYLSFPDGTCLVFDTLLKSWTKWTNIKANSFLVRDGVLYFSTSTGLIQKFDPAVFNDDGIAISFLLKTKNLDFGFPVQIKKLKRMWTIAKQFDAHTSTYNLNLIADYLQVSNNNISTDISGVWDEGDWDGADWDFKDVVKTVHKIRAKAEYLQVEITNSVLNEPLSIYRIIFRFKLKKPK